MGISIGIVKMIGFFSLMQTSVEIPNASIVGTQTLDGTVSITQIPSGAKLTATSLTLAKNQSVRSALVELGVFPNTDAFSLIYSINPNIGDLAKLTAGTSLVLPTVQSDVLNPLPTSAKQLAVLSYLSKERDSLVVACENLISKVKTLKDGAGRISPEGTAKIRLLHLVERLQMVAKSLKSVVSDNSRPATVQQFQSLAVELDLAAETINNTSKTGQIDMDPKQGTIATLDSLQKDIDLRLEAFGQTRGETTPPSRPRTARVQVDVVRQDQGVVPPNTYRICYAAPVVYRLRNGVPFSQMPQPVPNSVDDVPEGAYVFWVIRITDGIRVGEALEQKIRCPNKPSELVLYKIVIP